MNLSKKKQLITDFIKKKTKRKIFKIQVYNFIKEFGLKFWLRKDWKNYMKMFSTTWFTINFISTILLQLKNGTCQPHFCTA